MIYQLYPNTNYKCNPINKFYSTLCLDCLSSEYLPELKMEYSGMLYLWKNQLDNDDWVGFTSYRQLEKSRFILDDKNSIILNKLNKFNILCWYCLYRNLAHQAEKHHSDILYHLQLLLNYFNEEIPEIFFTKTLGCYANFWIMKKQNFIEFMEWSYPKVKKILELAKTNEYFKIYNHLSNSGFIIERLFVIWHLKFNKTIFPANSFRLTDDQS